MSLKCKISRESLNRLLENKQIESLENGVAVIDFANVMRSTDEKNGCQAIYNVESIEHLIDSSTNRLANVIRNLPKGISEVLIFSYVRTDNLYNISINDNMFPVEFSEDEINSFGYDSKYYSKLSNMKTYTYDHNTDIKNSELIGSKDKFILSDYTFPCSNQEGMFKTTIDELPLEKREEILKRKVLLETILKIPKKLKYEKFNKSYIYERRGFLNYITKNRFLANFYINIVENVRKEFPNIILHHISTPLEDDLAMRVYIEDDQRKHPSKQYYVVSNDCDVICNFADVRNSYWASRETIFKISDFWDSFGTSLSGISKRLIWGFLGSDYTTPIFKKLEIKRLILDDCPRESLQKYIGTDISDINIMNFCKKLANEVPDNVLRKVLLCSFNCLIGFNSCYFKYISKNDIRFNSYKDYQNHVLEENLWMFSFTSSKAFYLQPDRKGEFKNKIIRTLTVDGVKDFENNFVMYKWDSHKNRFLSVKKEKGTIQDKILRNSQAKNDRIEFVKILDEILKCDYQMTLSEIQDMFVKRLLSNNFIRDSLDEVHKKNAIEIILKKLNFICSNGCITENIFENIFENSANETQETIHNKQILDMFLKIYDDKDTFKIPEENALEYVNRVFN